MIVMMATIARTIIVFNVDDVNDGNIVGDIIGIILGAIGGAIFRDIVGGNIGGNNGWWLYWWISVGDISDDRHTGDQIFNRFPVGVHTVSRFRTNTFSPILPSLTIYSCV